jgi:hypothetical protein
MMRAIFWDVMSCNPVEIFSTHVSEERSASIFIFEEQVSAGLLLALLLTLKMEAVGSLRTQWASTGITSYKIM